MRNNKKYSTFLPLMFAILLLGGCFGSKEATTEPEVVQSQLVGKVWYCEMLFEREVFDDATISLEFLADGTVKGNGGCNNFTGTYTLAGKNLSFGPLATTKKSCGPALDEQEFTFLSFLKQINAAKVEDDELELFAPEVVSPMFFTTSEGGSFLW